MALVKCPECGREKVSDTAVSCPDCGYAVKEHYDKIKKIELEERIKRETAPKRQREEIKKINAKAFGYIEKIIIGVFCLIIFFPIFIFLFFEMESGNYVALFIALLTFVIGIMLLIAGIVGKRATTKELKTVKMNFGEYEKIKHRDTESLLKNTPNIKCPTCGSKNVERISIANRAVHAYAFGLFSKTAKSQFKCKDCGYAWSKGKVVEVNKIDCVVSFENSFKRTIKKEFLTKNCE